MHVLPPEVQVTGLAEYSLPGTESLPPGQGRPLSISHDHCHFSRPLRLFPREHRTRGTWLNPPFPSLTISLNVHLRCPARSQHSVHLYLTRQARLLRAASRKGTGSLGSSGATVSPGRAAHRVSFSGGAPAGPFYWRRSWIRRTRHACSRRARFLG